MTSFIGTKPHQVPSVGDLGRLAFLDYIGLDDVGMSIPTISSANTISPSTQILFVSGTTTINTIVPPPLFVNGGQITLIPTGKFTISVADNVAVSVSAEVSKPIYLTYDSISNKWYPSYSNTLNRVSITAPTTGSTLTIADGKTLTANSTLTLAGTDSKTLTVNKSLILDGADDKTLTLNASVTLNTTNSNAVILTLGNGGTVAYTTSPAITTSLTTPSASFDLINTTATTVNFAGAASTINIGALAGNTYINSGQVYVGGGSSLSTGSAGIEVGSGRTGAGSSFIDLVSDTTYTDYGARFIRDGAGLTKITTRGTGAFVIETSEAGILQFNTSATERMRIDATGICYHYASALELRKVNDSLRIRAVNSSSEATRYPGLEVFHYSGNLAGTADNGGFSALELFRSRGTEATKLAVQTNDQLGSITGWGWNTTAYDDVARINFFADNTFTTSDARGRIEFQTQTGTSLLTRMTITSAGVVSMAGNVTSTSSTTGTLQVTGGVGISENLNVGGRSKLALTPKYVGTFTIGANDSNWWRVASMDGDNQPRYSRFVLTTANHLNMEFVFSNGAGGDNGHVEVRVRGHYSYWTTYPYYVRYNPTGTNLPSYVEIQMPATGAGNTFFVYELETFSHSSAYVTYPMATTSSSAAATVGTNLQFFNSSSILRRDGFLGASVTREMTVPAAGTSGYLLTSNGSTWTSAAPPITLPTQTNNNGKYLTTDGSTASWTAISASALSATGTKDATTYLAGDNTWKSIKETTYTPTVPTTPNPAVISIDFSTINSTTIIINLPSGVTGATITFTNLSTPATSGTVFSFSVIVSHVSALSANTSVVFKHGSNVNPKWTGNIIPPSTVTAAAIDIWSFFTYDAGASLVGSLAMADVRNA